MVMPHVDPTGVGVADERQDPHPPLALLNDTFPYLLFRHGWADLRR